MFGEPGEEAANCVADIEQAHFVALRWDKSEILRDVNCELRPLELQAFYRNCTDHLRKVLPTRLGLCCGFLRSDIGACGAGIWELRAHELELWPGSCLDISPEVIARRLELADASKVGGVARGELHCEQKASRWAGQLACSVQWVVSALHRVSVPIVVHDGLLDMLQVYDKFAGEVPESVSEFGQALLNLFPLVFDTRVLAQGAGEIGQLRLETLRKLAKVSDVTSASVGDQCSMQFKECGFYTHRASSEELGLVSGDSNGVGSTARKAMAVAEIFVHQAGRLVRQVISQPRCCAQVLKPHVSRVGESIPAPERSPSPSRQQGGEGTRTPEKSTPPPLERAARIVAEVKNSQKEGDSNDRTPPKEGTILTTPAEVTPSPSRQQDGEGTRTPDNSPPPPVERADKIVGKVKNSEKESNSNDCTPPNEGTTLMTPAEVDDGLRCASFHERHQQGNTVSRGAFPVTRRKRPRNAMIEVATCVGVMDTFASRIGHAIFVSSPCVVTSCGTPKRLAADNVFESRIVLRRFLNRLAAPSTASGYVRLDTLIQVRLVKRLRKNQGEALKFARALWAAEDNDDAQGCKLDTSRSLTIDSKSNFE